MNKLWCRHDCSACKGPGPKSPCVSFFYNNNITRHVPTWCQRRGTHVGMVTGSHGEAPAEIRNAKREQEHKGDTSRGVPRSQSSRFICKRMPVMPLSVKPLSQLSLRNVRGSVTLSPPCQGSACCLCVPRTKPSFEEEGRK